MAQALLVQAILAQVKPLMFSASAPPVFDLGFVFVSLMAPLVITDPTGVKFFINDSGLAKVIVSEYLDRPRAPSTIPADSIKFATTMIAVAPIDSIQAVSSPSASSVEHSLIQTSDKVHPGWKTLPLSKRKLQPAPRKRGLSGSNHMAADVFKDVNQRDSMASWVSASNRILSHRHPVQLSNRFDALASYHSENDSKPTCRKRVSGCIANMDLDDHGPCTRNPSLRSSRLSSRSSSSEENHICPDCSSPLSFWCQTCKHTYGYETDE